MSIQCKLIIDLIFLPLIIFIGTITSYEDFRERRIRNKWIVLALVYSLLVYLFSFLAYKLASAGLLSGYFGLVSSYLLWNFDKLCVNLLISIILAYVLWRQKIWGAGDAKLFIAFASLIPICRYSKVYFNYYFASFLLLISVFIPSSIYIIVRSVVYLFKEKKTAEFANITLAKIGKGLFEVNVKERVKLLAGIFLGFLSIRLILVVISGHKITMFLSQAIMLVLSFFMLPRAISYLKERVYLFIFAGLALMLAYYFFNKSLSAEIPLVFGTSFIVMAVFPFFQMVSDFYIEKVGGNIVPFAHWIFLGVLIAWFV